MTISRLLTALAMSTVAFAGCTITRVCNSDGGMEIVVDENGESDVRIDDVCFKEGLAVEQISSSRNAFGILIATVVIRNTRVDRDDHNREDAFTIQYKATWFDARGMAVLPDSSPWVQKKLDGGGSESIKIVAPTKEATRFMLRIKHVR